MPSPSPSQSRSTPAGITATEYRIDNTHANPRVAWATMGSPAVPSTAQIEALVAASEVKPTAVPVSGGAATIDMPANSAVLLVFK